MDRALKDLGKDTAPAHATFEFAKKLDKQSFTDAGFERYLCWYQQINQHHRNGKDFRNYVKSVFDGQPDEVYQKVTEIYDGN